MKSPVSFLFIFLFIGISFIVPAQNPVITKVAKFKPPVVQTSLGVSTNGAVITKEDAAQLIALPLKITDAKKNVYIVSSYQFLYKRKSVVQDEDSGKKESMFTTVADRFKATPLPKIWIDNLHGGFQKDEELYFFDIVAKDNAGRLFPAPELRLKIQ